MWGSVFGNVWTAGQALESCLVLPFPILGRGCSEEQPLPLPRSALCRTGVPERPAQWAAPLSPVTQSISRCQNLHGYHGPNTPEQLNCVCHLATVLEELWGGGCVACRGVPGGEEGMGMWRMWLSAVSYKQWVKKPQFFLSGNICL